MSYYDQVKEAADTVSARARELPRVGVVLGSGLGGFAATLGDAVEMRYEQLPWWPASRVPGHEGRLVIGRARGRLVAALAGRCHAYEGHDLGTVTFAVRVLGLLGVRVFILTNAAGGINATFTPGTLMVIDDHINLMGGNPLASAHDDRFGPRFVDMTGVYSARLQATADEAGREAGVVPAHGVYAAMLGPSYETPAEIRYLRTIGVDAVGMSTVPEAIAVRQFGAEVLGISCISNMAAGILPAPLSHAEVIETARRVSGQFMALLEAIIGRL